MNSEVKRLYLKIRSFCARAERCEQEAAEKLKQWGLGSEDINACLQLLAADGFIDNGRYARAFTSDKFRLQKWGKLKITHHLKAKGIARPLIETALQTEINEQEYQQTLHELAIRKKMLLREEDAPLLKKQKLTQYLLQKGYEPVLVQKQLAQLQDL